MIDLLVRRFARVSFDTTVAVAFLVVLLIAFAVGRAQGQAAPQHIFRVDGHQFQLDGKPLQIISGEMHYPRVPRADWRDRFRKARAMGLNTITTYVFWNVHEPRPGVYDFSGQNDVAEYIREAQEEGLYVILRPGPYVCAEWELGGYPSWLLKDRSLVLRSSDPQYLAAVQRWFHRLGAEIAPLLLKNGGPILAIQVENEYGSFGDDHGYMEAVKTALVESGMDGPVLYTADGPRGTAERIAAGAAGGDQLRGRRRPRRLRHSGAAAAGRASHDGRVLGGVVRSLGRKAPHDECGAGGGGAELDAEPGVFGERVPV